MKKLAFLSTIMFITLAACTTTRQIFDDINKSMGGSSSPSDAEISTGLRQALIKGVTTGVEQLSKVDGYFGNPAIKILWPPEAKKVEETLRGMGLDPLCDKVILSLNRAAEKAAKEAKPIFVDAIKQLTFQDVKQILFGPDNAATTYLKNKTTDQLKAKFKPIIAKSLNEVQATKYWSDVMSRYNKIPFVQPVNTDLPEYVTLKAIDGLFMKIEEEERKIRENPVARTTEILRKVFGYYDANKG